MKKTNFIDKGNWYKGNTHLHTTRSDGKKNPQEAIKQYRNLGYKFFVMSDHRIYFDSTDLDRDDFLVLSGIELNTNRVDDGYSTHHVTGLKKYKETKEYKNDQKFETLFWDDEFGHTITNKLIKEANEHDNFTILAHPQWSCSFPEDLLGLKDFDAIEVWNQECEAASATGNGEYYYDYLLKKGKKIFAIASDDVHSYRDVAIGGFIVVKAKEFTKKSIAHAIVEGSYYSSTGPHINEFYIKDNTVYAKGSQCESIKLIFHYRGKTFYGLNNEGISEIQYELKGNEKYVRCEFINSNGKKAWSNPLFLD